MLDTLADLAIILFVVACAIKVGSQRFLNAHSSKIISASVAELRKIQSSAATAAEFHWEDELPKIKKHLKARGMHINPQGFDALKGEYVHYVVDLATSHHVNELRTLEKKYGRINTETHDQLLYERDQHIADHRNSLIEAGVNIDDLDKLIIGDTASTVQ